jgi:hypothetical protein
VRSIASTNPSTVATQARGPHRAARRCCAHRSGLLREGNPARRSGHTRLCAKCPHLSPPTPRQTVHVPMRVSIGRSRRSSDCWPWIGPARTRDGSSRGASADRADRRARERPLACQSDRSIGHRPPDHRPPGTAPIGGPEGAVNPASIGPTGWTRKARWSVHHPNAPSRCRCWSSLGVLPVAPPPGEPATGAAAAARAGTNQGSPRAL